LPARWRTYSSCWLLSEAREVTVPTLTVLKMAAKGKGKAYRWILVHQDYPHDWCLVWPFFRDKHGRGWLSHNGETGYAHRFMCRLVKGEPPTPLHGAAHSCGNGEGGCVNPRHLSWKTQAENLADCAIHGTQPKHRLGPKGHFTWEQVETIRERLLAETQLQIANSLGVSESTISDIARRKHYANPPTHNFWTEEEDTRLREAILRGENFTQAAVSVGRPVKATTARAYRIGLRSGQPPTRTVQ
jgi:hypothetical protein